MYSNKTLGHRLPVWPDLFHLCSSDHWPSSFILVLRKWHANDNWTVKSSATYDCTQIWAKQGMKTFFSPPCSSQSTTIKKLQNFKNKSYLGLEVMLLHLKWQAPLLSSALNRTTFFEDRNALKKKKKKKKEGSRILKTSSYLRQIIRSLSRSPSRYFPLRDLSVF